MRSHIKTLILLTGLTSCVGCHRVDWSQTQALAQEAADSELDSAPGLAPDQRSRGLCDPALSPRVAHLLDQPPVPPLVASRDALTMRGSFRDWCVFLQAGEPVAWVTVLPDPTGHEFRDLAQSVDIYRSDVRLTTVAGRPALDLEEHGIVVSSGGDMWSFTVHHPADRSSVEPHDREREFALEVFRAVAAS